MDNNDIYNFNEANLADARREAGLDVEESKTELTEEQKERYDKVMANFNEANLEDARREVEEETAASEEQEKLDRER